MVTENGPGVTAATFESGGRPSAPPEASSAQGSVIDGATTSATSFSIPSAKTVGPASTSSNRSRAQAVPPSGSGEPSSQPALPEYRGSEIGFEIRAYASQRTGRRSNAKDFRPAASGSATLS